MHPGPPLFKRSQEIIASKVEVWSIFRREDGEGGGGSGRDVFNPVRLNTPGLSPIPMGIGI